MNSVITLQCVVDISGALISGEGRVDRWGADEEDSLWQ